MKKILIIILLAFSCITDEKDIVLTANPQKVVLYNYQDVYCVYKAKGLGESLESGKIDSINFKITIDDEEILKGLTFDNDSIYFMHMADLMVPDSVTENFTDSIISYNYIGQLAIYSNDTKKVSADTVKLQIINPLENERMKGDIIKGKREGVWLEYYDNQLTELARKSYFKSGKRYGSDSIFKNDILYYVINWTEGHKDGSFKVFWPNGIIKWETRYNNGMPVEPVSMYNNLGEKTGSFELR
ncbi:hypothetical protein GCM10011506_38020 [Marivirga lumbricoides]|uniref:Toxin-antitoxin system YwqK family antitoxin n=1 Tax=Marivirga lumbricoides TaxID=1046115 RepID=A0ABQ1N0Z1_9BACT|nr:hypothetical protein GCM10011506_38020 [Marivirga lumbricoides]